MSEDTFKPEGRHVTAVEHSYERFWNQLCGAQGVDAERNPDAIEARRDEENIVVGTKPVVESSTEETYLQFEGKRYRRDRPNDLMDICLQFNQTIQTQGHPENPQYIVTKSTTWVSYLRYVGNPPHYTRDGRRHVELKYAMHYDYENEPKLNHPVFHAQYDPRSIDLDVLSERYAIKNADSFDDEYPQFPRVPSAPMDITGVVFLILKDHSDEEEQWPPKVQSDLRSLPAFSGDCFTPKPQEGVPMYPEWWYAHASNQGNLMEDVIQCRQGSS